MAQRDYYEILDLERSASDKQIKSSYRRLARKYHPDVNKSSDADKKFKEATAAYEVLSDPKKRKMYDQFGRAGSGQAGFGSGAPGWTKVYTQNGSRGGPMPGSGFGDPFSSGGFGGMSLNDLLAALGGGMRRKPKRPSCRSAPETPVAEAHITLEFMQAVNGCSQMFQIRKPDGQNERVEVKIPPGVRTGSKIRLRSKGAAQAGGRGDLHIIVNVREHPFFSRDGNDIYIDLPVGITEAAMGATVTVPTIDGRADVKIPPGTAGKTRLRLKGKGVADPKTSKRGDQYAVIKIVPPKKISEKGRKLMEEFNESDPCNPREKLDW